MIIKSVHIEKFRAFENVSFILGKRITAIAGRNATLKTTILGMIGQPFSITKKDHALLGSRTIDGYDFRSQFSEKFKISSQHDVIGQHKWTLNFYNQGYYHNNMITVESIARKQTGKPDSLRFWNAAGRSAGQGYVQLPVYFLSLSRLYPIGEVGKTKPYEIELTDSELEYCIRHYQDILSISGIQGTPSISVEKGSVKRTVAGFNDATHDIFTNSAGEGNIARILLAMLSFRRLKEQNARDYKGGILLIDELDATIYPHSQKKLVEYLLEAADEFRVQVVFTTHSETVLRAVHEQFRYEQKTKGITPIHAAYDNTIIYLEPVYNGGVRMITAENIDSAAKLRRCINDMSLNPTMPDEKLRIYCEDSVAVSLAEYLLRKYDFDIDKYFSFIDINLGWTNYIQLWEKNVPEFRQSLLLLDADVPNNNDYRRKPQETRSAENILFLPFSVERDLFELLKDTNNYTVFNRDYSTNQTFTYDVCFSDWPRVISDYSGIDFKEWFGRVDEILGRNLLFDFWLSLYRDNADTFIRRFYAAYASLADKLSLDPLPNPFEEQESINNTEDDETIIAESDDNS